MKIFIDSARPEQISKYVSWGICDGVTTNPSIHVKDGVRSFSEMEARSRQIAQLIDPLPFFVEVTSDAHDEMIKQGRMYATWGKNVSVKITITTAKGESCLGAISTLTKEGIDVNATALMTFNQAILAAKAGARYISLFGGRIDDEGSEASEVIMRTREWLDRWGHTLPTKSEIIVGSSRTTKNVADWASTGAHILTITPDLIDKLLINARTKETVAQFLNDAQSALKNLSQQKETTIVEMDSPTPSLNLSKEAPQNAIRS